MHFHADQATIGTHGKDYWEFVDSDKFIPETVSSPLRNPGCFSFAKANMSDRLGRSVLSKAATEIHNLRQAEVVAYINLN